MGMQRRANTFFVETRGRRDVYKKPGTDGLMLDDADAKRMWEGCPAELSVAYDVNDAVKRVKQANPVSNFSLLLLFSSDSCQTLVLIRHFRIITAERFFSRT